MIQQNLAVPENILIKSWTYIWILVRTFNSPYLRGIAKKREEIDDEKDTDNPYGGHAAGAVCLFRHRRTG